MPGLHTVLNTQNKPYPVKFKNALLYEEYMYIDDLFQTDSSTSFLSIHKGYPYYKSEYKDYQILLLGMIYNYNSLDIHKMLEEIIDTYIEQNILMFRNRIIEFVEKMDGDFIIQIVSTNNDLIIFNDMLGRLPLYFSHQNEQLILSSEIKTILFNLDHIEFDKISILEYILQEYNISDFTLYENIKKLKPGHLLVSSMDKNKVSYKLYPTKEINFITNTDISKENFLINCVEDLNKSLKDRTKTLSKYNYNLIADISGGFDSRTIAGGLANITDKVVFHTYEYIQDESIVSKKVIQELYEKKNNFRKILGDNSVDSYNSGKFVFINDSLTNFFTSSVCYQDLNHLKQIENKVSARFMGLGGSDFLRHPLYQTPLLHINKSSNFGWYKKLHDLANLLNVNEEGYKKRINLYLKNIPEKKKNDILKRLYFEYQRNYVSLAGEDRERIQFWTVLPLWSNPIIKRIANELNLKWTGYKFYIDFMRRVNPKTLNIDIYKKNINIRSNISTSIFDFKLKIRSLFMDLKFILPIFDFSMNIFRKKENINEHNALMVLVTDLSKNNTSFQRIVNDKQKLKILNIEELKRVATLMIYSQYLQEQYDLDILLTDT